MGGLWGQKFKHLDNLPNGWTDWHQIWYTPADSSGNGHRLNTISPSIPQGALGGLRGQQFISLDNLPNGWTDWHYIWYTSADSSGNGHRLKTISPSMPQGAEPSIPQVAGHQSFIKSLRNAMICTEKLKINYIKMKCTN